MRKHLRPLKKLYPYLITILSRIFCIILSPAIIEKIISYKRIVITHNSVNFSLRNISHMTNYRAHTFLTKEPETLKWIESFAPNSILLDVGANIGIYSLYAAKLSHKVISIEPDALNFALLSLNVNDNKLQNLISTFCCAAGSKFGLERLSSRAECWGGALKEISYNKNLETNPYVQDIIIIDPILLANPLFFGSEELHLKVDVDGNEDQIIFDGCNLLELKNLSSILIELDISHSNYQSIISNINRCGFTLGGIYSCSIVGVEFNNMKNHIFYKNK